MTLAIPARGVRRLARYPVRLNRALFAVSVAGIFNVAHLGIQRAVAFSYGELGLGLLDASPALSTQAVLRSEATAMLGLSGAAWSGAVFAAVAALTLAMLAARPRERLYLHAARLAVVLLGGVYATYTTVVQFTYAEALCALCLTSAALAAILIAVQGWILASPQTMISTMTQRSYKREFVLFTYLIACTVVLAGADLTYFRGLERAKAVAAADTTQVAPGCYYTGEGPVQDFEQLISFQDPARGASDADVTIVEYFDPNCPHCKTMHGVMKQAIDQYGDEARFVFKPMPLWGYSVPQIEALYAAAQEGKFFAMLDGQYARQQRGGLSEKQLRAIAREIGMNPDVLMSRVQQQAYRDRVRQEFQKAKDIGVDSTPTLIINGQFVSGRSRTVECIGAFIEAENRQVQTTASEGAGEQ
jgi:protein-disulfide isomerase/uncharacterized membrane protein